MSITIDPEHIEARLTAEAQACGVPLPQLLQEFLIDHVLDIEDPEIAEITA